MKNKILLFLLIAIAMNSGCSIVSDEMSPTDRATTRFDAHPEGDVPNSAAAYATSNCKWDTCSISYYIDNFTDQLSSIDQQNMFEQVLKVWHDASGIQFDFIDSRSQADILFSFEEVDGIGNRLAYTFFPCDENDNRAGNVIIDKDESWSLNVTSSNSEPYDLFTVVLHEVGHALGLDHSSEESALMYADYSGSHRQLDDDDILGIHHLYQCNSNNGCGNSTVNLEFGLIGYYPFNGSTTGLATNAWLTADRFGQSNKAYHFDGYSAQDNPSRILIQSCSSTGFGDNFSFTGWIKMDGNNGMNPSGLESTYNVIHTIFAKDFYKGNAVSASILCYNNEKYLRFASPNGVNQVKIDIVNGIWAHIAITYDDSERKLSIYKNGELVSCKNFYHNIASTNEQQLIIGSCKKGFGGNNNSFRYWYPFYGSLDELRFYNRSLSSAEISMLAQM